MKTSMLVRSLTLALAFASVGCSAASDDDVEVGRTPQSERGTSAPGTTTPAPASEEAAGTWPFIGDRPMSCFTDKKKARAYLTVPITEAIANQKTEIFSSEAYVVKVESCHLAPKGTDAKCKPFVVLSETRNAGIKQPITPQYDLVVFVPDAKAFELFGHYKVVYEVCPRASGGPAGRLLESATIP